MPGQSTRGTNGPLRFTFDPTNGTLTRYDGELRFSFRAHPPQARVRWRGDRRWRIDEAPDLLDFPELIERADRYRRDQERATTAPDANHEAVCRFLDLIPAQLQQELRVFPSRSWRLFGVLYRYPPALELTQTNRALSFALANGSDFVEHLSGSPLALAGAWAGRRRRDIAEMLGFDARPTAVRILSRVVPASIDIIVLLWLRRALRSDEVRQRLGHLERINRGVIALAVNPFTWRGLSPQFMIEVSTATDLDAGDRRIEQMLHDTVEMMTTLDRTGTKFSSLASLRDTHRELVKVFAERPPPVEDQLAEQPLPGIAGVIEPLSTAHELWREGMSQKNCVSAPHYAREVAAGSLYVYRLLSPERCTLSIRRSGKSWVVSELERAHNRKASKATWQRVRAWLANDGLPPEETVEPPRRAKPVEKCPPRSNGPTQLSLLLD